MEGSLIPLADGEGAYAKDPTDGRIVKSRLDEARLREIAAAAGGFYTHLQNGPEDMKKIVQEGLGKMKEHDIDARMSRRPIERYQWPLGAGLALIVASMFISERRREGKGESEGSKWNGAGCASRPGCAGGKSFRKRGTS